MSPSRTSLPLGEHDEGRRLDRILRRLLPAVSLGRIYTLIRKGEIRVSGRRRPASYRMERDDRLELPEELAPADAGNPAATIPAAAIPEGLADRVVYENEHLLAVDKPAGMPVHGRDGLLAALRPYLEGGERKSISFRPGPIHRLDRNTSGIMLFPRSLRGSQRASELLRSGRLDKGYLALLSGRLPGVELWEDTLERDSSRNVTRVVAGAPTGKTGGTGRQARSVVAPLVHGATGGAAVTLALIRIETGRTHQIRAQAEAHGYPLPGDTKYGGRRPRDAYFLHAAVLINRDPDEIFPERTICAPPAGERRETLDARLGVGGPAAELDAALDCTALSAFLSGLVYKEPGNQ